MLLVLTIACQKKKESEKTKNTVILVSIDGFRYDYSSLYHTPNLDLLAKKGVKAKSLIPSYPSKTFPNHYSIVTGLYPQNHGIVHNVFYDVDREQKYHIGLEKKDATWCKGIPLWNLAEQQGVKSASFYWPISDARVGGMQSTYFYKYNKSTPYEERIDQIEQWLAMDKTIRPQFISLYFSLVDTQGHRFGPKSNEVKEAVEYVDDIIGQLNQVIENSNQEIDLVIVSDHGMIQVDRKHPIIIENITDFKGYNVVNAGGSQLFLYQTDKSRELQDMKSILEKDENFKVYLKNEMPERLHYNKGQRIPDIICEVQAGKCFIHKGNDLRKVNGMHGLDPYTNKEMHAIFYAVGPHFKKGVEIDAFENVNIYPAIAEILGLSIDHEIDGSIEVMSKVMEK